MKKFWGLRYVDLPLLQSWRRTTAVDQQAHTLATRRLIARIVLVSAILFFGGMMIWLSVARHTGYNTTVYDLGRMAQAIGSGTRGELLINTNPHSQDLASASRLGGHFEIFYFLLVPFYALWPDPRLLVIVQAILFALGAIPAYRIALRHMQSQVLACCIVLIYLLYPAAQTSVLFDFHGDTLAMPLLLFAIDALDARAWRRYAFFVALALSCKFYVFVAVVGIGVYAFLWGGQRKAGFWTVLAAGLYGAVVSLGIRPLFQPKGDVGAQETYVNYYFGQIFTPLLDTYQERLVNVFYVFGPAALLLLFGWRWIMMASPIIAAVLISSGPGVYEIRFHHYALVVPFIVMAIIDGFERLRAADTSGLWRFIPRFVRSSVPPGALVIATLVLTLLFNMRVLDTPLSPKFWRATPHIGLHEWRFGITSRDEMKDRFLAEEVHPTAPLAASLTLAPHLANRDTLFAVKYLHAEMVVQKFYPDRDLFAAILPRVDYVLADSLHDWIVDSDFEWREIRQTLDDPAFDLVTARDGLLLFQRDAPPEAVLEQHVTVQQVSSVPPLRAQFGDSLGLVDVQITPLGERRFRATFTWFVTDSLPSEGHYAAVSRLGGTQHARIVHVPTYFLEPTTRWEAGDLVRETFDVEIPADVPAGSYAWLVGWYDMKHPFSQDTDARSRLPDSQEIVVAEITVP